MAEKGVLLENRYRLVDVLGRGGMSTVYLAEDMKLPGSLWAVKELVCFESRHLGQIKESFEREAAMLSSLRHPNLPVIVDYFTSEDRAYLVMEYVRGKTLLQIFEEAGGELPAETVEAWALQGATVLDYLHTLDPPVIFRDVKPANIMQCDDGSLKLIDFGLARCFDPRKPGDTFPAASWGFASPEQLSDVAQTDPRSDIYSWGATFYFLLTGKIPPSADVRRPVAELNPRVSGHLARAIDRALKGARDERFSNFGQIIAQLKAPSAHHGRRFPWIPAALALLLAALLLVLLRASPPIRREPHAPPSRSLPGWEDFKARGDDFASKGRYAEAVEEYAKSLTRRPRNGEVHILRENAMISLMGSKAVRVGLVLPLTGFGARAGVLACRGAALAQEEINARGGIGGRKVFLALSDDRSTVKESIASLRSLAVDASICSVIGPLSLRQVNAVAPIANEAGLPLVSPTSSSPDIFALGGAIFSTAFTYFREIGEIARAAASEGPRSRPGVLLNVTDEFSQETAAAFKTHARRRGAQDILTVEYRNKTEDFAPQAADFVKMTVCSVFFSGYNDDQLVKFCRALKNAGLSIPVYCLPMALDEERSPEDKKALEGVVFAQYFSPFAPESASFVSRYRRLFRMESPSQFTAETYEAARLVFSAIEGSGGGRREIRAHLAALGTTLPPFPGLMGSVVPSRGRSGGKVHLLQIRDGSPAAMNQPAGAGRGGQ
jgi:ABC-type branched-subunit amino acid transport system substrate-binding protein